MNPRAQRIVETAVELAEKGGFEAVRLRDVASDADVALGTLYRYFRSKEDLLIAVLTLEVEQLVRRIRNRPPSGGTALERLNGFFNAATKGLCRRPRLARAILRAAASGDHELAEKVHALHSTMTDMIITTMRDQGGLAAGDGNRAENPASTPAAEPSQSESDVALLLQHIWFATLVGWAGGLITQSEIIERMNTGTALLLAGMNSRSSSA